MRSAKRCSGCAESPADSRAALEVDVVQLVAVDEPAGGHVPDLGVVVPAVPQPPDHLDVIGGLLIGLRLRERNRPSPEMPCLVGTL